MIYDGDCCFCSLWIRRWRQATGEAVEYLPFQDLRIAEWFPEVPRQQFETAVQLIEPEGAVFGGAEAVFRTLAHKPHEHWLLDLYYRLPPFARAAELGYRLVARHRTFFSALTRFSWGHNLEQPTHFLVRWAFLRALGIIYLIAFVSLWTQIIGLVGRQGIQPAGETMSVLRHQVEAARIGLDRYHLVPTFCWFNASDRCLKVQCAAGTVLAALLILGIAPAPCLFLLWLIYLSLSTVCVEFLSFQWDILLLQAGFLAIFLAPLQVSPRWLVRGPALLAAETPPSRVVLWLMRWLLFQLIFESGCVKLASGDTTWRHLTALDYHYGTQPLPTWIAWYANQLPALAQKASIVIMFGIELVVPFLVFAPRRLRQFACWAQLFLQVLIMLTGNYGFFNLLTIALCLLLLDDAALTKVLPRRMRAQPPSLHEPRSASHAPHPFPLPIGWGEGGHRPGEGWVHSPNAGPQAAGAPQSSAPARRKWPLQVTVPLACVSVVLGLMHIDALRGRMLPWPMPFLATYIWVSPFRTFNSYGLFAVMTTTRPEVIIEGSNDGVKWLEYEFKYKPGDLKRRPAFVEPHMPRLDWQMWFAALGDIRRNLWVLNFCGRLLQGSPGVLGLLGHNPFPHEPPRYIRAVLYDYHFTDFATRRKTGDWWQRRKIGEYLPAISLREEPARPGNQAAATAAPAGPGKATPARPRFL